METEIDAVFDAIHKFSYDTSYTAKSIIIAADSLHVTTAEYLKAVEDWIDEFEKKVKAGKE